VEWRLENYAKGEIKNSTYEEYERTVKVHLYPEFEKNFPRSTERWFESSSKEPLEGVKLRNRRTLFQVETVRQWIS